MNIIASLYDPDFSKKYREGRHSIKSKWEWGIGEDGELYFRDMDHSIYNDWLLTKRMPINIDMETIDKLYRWKTSIHLKNNLKSLRDKNT